MSRRCSTTRRAALESLEIRCNPSTLDLSGGSLVVPPPTDERIIDPGPAYTFTIDPRSSSSSTGGGLDILIGNTGGDRIAPTGKLYVATDVGVFVEAAASNESGISTALVVDPSNPNIVYSRPDLESIIDDLARDVASHIESRSSAELASFFAFPGYVGGASVAGGDVNADKIDDIVTGAGLGASPHVK